jgi:hypothetical protein
MCELRGGMTLAGNLRDRTIRAATPTAVSGGGVDADDGCDVSASD